MCLLAASGLDRGGYSQRCSVHSESQIRHLPRRSDQDLRVHGRLSLPVLHYSPEHWRSARYVAVVTFLVVLFFIHCERVCDVVLDVVEIVSDALRQWFELIQRNTPFSSGSQQ